MAGVFHRSPTSYGPSRRTPARPRTSRPPLGGANPPRSPWEASHEAPRAHELGLAFTASHRTLAPLVIEARRPCETPVPPNCHVPSPHEPDTSEPSDQGADTSLLFREARTDPGAPSVVLRTRRIPKNTTSVAPGSLRGDRHATVPRSPHPDHARAPTPRMLRTQLAPRRRLCVAATASKPRPVQPTSATQPRFSKTTPTPCPCDRSTCTELPPSVADERLGFTPSAPTSGGILAIRARRSPPRAVPSPVPSDTPSPRVTRRHSGERFVYPGTKSGSAIDPVMARPPPRSRMPPPTGALAGPQDPHGSLRASTLHGAPCAVRGPSRAPLTLESRRHPVTRARARPRAAVRLLPQRTARGTAHEPRSPLPSRATGGRTSRRTSAGERRAARSLPA